MNQPTTTPRRTPTWPTLLAAGALLALLFIGLLWVRPLGAESRTVAFNWENALAGGWLAQTEEPEPEPDEPLTMEGFPDAVLLDEAIRAGLIGDGGEIVEPERPAATAFAAALRSAVGAAVGVGFDLRFGLGATYDCGPGVPRETRTINPAIRPWGLDGGGSEDFDLFSGRYWEGRRNTTCWPSGFAGELFAVNRDALNNWAKLGCFDPPLPRAGEATSEEQYDLAVTAGGRRHPLYQKCWWEQQAGGHQDRPVIVSGGAWGHYRGVAQAHGICTTGLHSWPSIWGWAQWMRVDELPADRPWCAAVPPVPVPVPPPAPAPQPAPAPVPVPVPAPPPPDPCPPDRLARCQALKSPFGQEVCAPCPCPPETPPRVDASGAPKAWHCSTPQGVESPPPPARPMCRVYRVIASPPAIVLPYVQGIESTGRLVIELWPAEEVECP